MTTSMNDSSTLRIAGIGWGLFILIALAVVFLLICIAYRKTEKANVIYFATTSSYVTLAAILIASPKVPPGQSLIQPDQLDYTSVARWIYVIISSIIAVGSGLYTLSSYLFTPIYAINPEDMD